VKATRPASEEVPDSAIAEYFVTEFGFARGGDRGGRGHPEGYKAINCRARFEDE
jgi:hypothetical protein